MAETRSAGMVRGCYRASGHREQAVAPGLAPGDEQDPVATPTYPMSQAGGSLHTGSCVAAGPTGKPWAPPPPVPHQPWRGSRVQALSVPPRCFAGTQSSVESAVRFSTAGLWRASPARPCRGAVLFTALLAASVPGESVVMTCTANGEAMAVPCGLLRAGIVAAPVTPASPKCIYRAL